MAPLRGFRFLRVGAGPVERRAGALLGLLGAEVIAVDAADAAAGRVRWPGPPAHGVLDGCGGAGTRAGTVVVDLSDRRCGTDGWAASGAMALTGWADGPALTVPGDAAGALHAAAAVVELLSALGGRRVAVDGAALVGERAALTGLGRRGSSTVGGAGRLVPAADGWLAVSLPRPSDRELLGAWLGVAVGDDHWAAVAAALADRTTAGAVQRAQELGLAVAPVVTPGEAATDVQAVARGQSLPLRPFLLDGRPPPITAPRPGTAGTGPAGGRGGGVALATPRTLAGARVVDLSSLWAGPLATSLLADAGATVVKVESTGRPDGARAGPPAVFDLLNAAKRSVALDLADPTGVAALRALVEGADLVVEASRPRALDQVGITRRAPWLSITAYGRTGPWCQWSGFGDDAAVAGGLVARGADGTPCFAADAFADPAAGLHAAAAALATLVGAPVDVDLALREVVNHVISDPEDGDPHGEEAGARPGRPPAGGSVTVAPPRARPSRGAAPPLGEANTELLGAGGARR